jgi:UDP-N-acetylglucosamine acyltransferase
MNFIGHDVIIGNGVIMTAACRLAGVVEIEDNVNLGISVKIHQRMRIGQGAMLGMGSVITKSVLPYSKVAGVPAKTIGDNIKRHNKTLEEVQELRDLFTKKGGKDETFI